MPFKLTLAAKVPPNSGSFFFVPVVLSVSTGAELTFFPPAVPQGMLLWLML